VISHLKIAFKAMEKDGKSKGGRVVKVYDKNGGALQIFTYEDLYLWGSFHIHLDPSKVLASIRELNYCKGDVMVCAYPKSGTCTCSKVH